MSQQKFDLFEISAVLPAKLSAGTAEIVSPKVLDSDLLR
jgi:hypothetical protein